MKVNVSLHLKHWIKSLDRISYRPRFYYSSLCTLSDMERNICFLVLMFLSQSDENKIVIYKVIITILYSVNIADILLACAVALVLES